MDGKLYFLNQQEKRNQLRNFFYKQQLSAQAKMLHLFELLQSYGSHLGMPHAKQLGAGLYELRVRGKEELRILYSFNQSTIYLFTCF